MSFRTKKPFSYGARKKVCPNFLQELKSFPRTEPETITRTPALQDSREHAVLISIPIATRKRDKLEKQYSKKMRKQNYRHCSGSFSVATINTNHVQPHVDGMNGDVVLHESTQDEGYEVANDIPIHTSTHDEEYEVAGANVSIPTDAPNIVDKVHEQPLISTPVSGRSTVQASHSVSTSSSEQNGSPALSEEEVVATDQDVQITESSSVFNFPVQQAGGNTHSMSGEQQ
ncbi:hypothetical protein V6N12_036901 [Hibiscus sabdariffa]|uniref:Uncharacterized protein n=1 Tax=Hibiscus sabdariffa TaxID=183260 RepID=A0ABR2BV11_9ROSI